MKHLEFIVFVTVLLALACQAHTDDVEASGFVLSESWNTGFVVTVTKTTNTSTVVVNLADITGAGPPTPPTNGTNRTTAQWGNHNRRPNITAITNAVLEKSHESNKYTVTFTATTITIVVNTPTHHSSNPWTHRSVKLSVTGTTPAGGSLTGKVIVKILRPKTKPGRR